MIEFFREHKLVRGSISILLALLLLPLYTFVAVVVETARYRSAQEQLGELTFLGEMAILADYMDFLADDYGLFAYECVNAETIKNSFSKYMNKVTSAGGADTRKLNKLFGVDIEQCDIQYMYSIADPDVLAYQIRQNGRYALPVKLMDEFVLEGLFDELGKKLKGVNKNLGMVANCASSVENATSFLAAFNDMDNALTNLTSAIDDVSAYGEKMENKKTDVKWEVLDNPLFTDVYDIWRSGEDIEAYSTSRKGDMPELLARMTGWRSDFQTYFDCPLSERNDCKVDITEDIGSLLGVYPDSENKADCGTVLTALSNKLHVSSITDMTTYDNELNKLNGLCENIDEIYELYVNSVSLFELVDMYTYKKELTPLLSDLGYYYRVEKLNAVYSQGEKSYIGTVKKMRESFSGMVQSYSDAKATVDAIEEERLTEELNAAGKTTAKQRAELANKPTNERQVKAEAEQTMAQYKVQYKENVNDRQEKYRKALKNKDFATIGTHVLEQFSSEMDKVEMDNWTNNLQNKFVILPKPEKLSKDVSANTFIENARLLQGYNFTQKYLDKYDLYSINGFDPTDTGKYDQIDQFDTDWKNVENMKDGQKKEKLRKEIYETNYLDNTDLENIYKPFINSIDSNSVFNDISNPWFKDLDDTSKSYYFSKETIFIFYAFLIGATFASGSEVNGLLSALKTVFDYADGLMPDSYDLNNHIGKRSDSQGISLDQITFIGRMQYSELTSVDNITFPSRTQYYDSEGAGWQENYNPAEIEKNAKTASHQYTGALFGGSNDLSTERYYIKEDKTQSSFASMYNNIFQGRDPGRGMMNVISGITGVIDYGSEFVSDIQNLSIGKLLKLVWDMMGFINSVIALVSGLISLVVDYLQLISMIIKDIIDGTTDTLQYVLDQFYIVYFASSHFTSRQTAKGGDGDFTTVGEKHSCNSGECMENKKIFDGAEMEYLLGGHACEINNQHTAFYGILLLRFLLNFSIVAADELAQQVTNIPYAGPVLLVLLVIAESHLDMMFLISGVKVPLIKTKMSLNPENITNFFEQLKQGYNNALCKKMTWTMEEVNGVKYRVYEPNKSADSIIKDSMEDNFLAKDDDTQVKNMKEQMGVGDSAHTGGGKSSEGFISLTYDWYINFLLLYYPEDVKLARIADLLQMHGMEKKGIKFDLTECYTYVYADVNANYAPLLPMITDSDEKSLFPRLRAVQTNGY